ncbi:MAG TPA: prephenate dehydrogenase [Anaerolineales bacterium]|nr:prephenate dehydrogenase [Anaerolineales bacterium]
MSNREIRLSIIGLGPIGASFGLALASRRETLPLLRIGHDPEPLQAQAAKKAGAVDKITLTLSGAVNQADIVLLSLPLHEIRKTLEHIAPDLKPDAVVLDTSPAKARVAAWAKDLLPAHVHYVGLLPVINPMYLLASSAEEPRADLFHHTVMGIVAPVETPGPALKLAADLTALVGATPLFLDIAEADGLLAAVEVLPQLLAAALVHTTTGEPGWRESRKLAGRAYAAATEAADHPTTELSETLLAHRHTLPHLLTRLTAQMDALAQWLNAGDAETIRAWWDQAARARRRWLGNRQRNAWETAPPTEAPSIGDTFRALLGLRRPEKPSS